MYRTIFIVLGVLLFSGCSTKQPFVTEFRINAQVKSKDSDANKCLDASIKVAQSFSSSDIASSKMNYAKGAHKQFAYTESQWADAPNRVINAQIVKLLKSAKLYKTVQTSKSRSASDFILEIDIEDFMQYFNEEQTESYAQVVISLSLIETVSNKVVATRTFESKIKSQTLDAQGGVKGLNSALEDVLEQMDGWFIGVCK